MKSILKAILYISFFLYLSVVSAQSICSISEAELTYNTANCLSGYSGIKLESENQKSIDNILNTIGIANANFVTKSCKDIYNAFAYYDSYNKIRYIALDENFIYNLNPKNYQWTSVFVLAHEIAHHLNGHTITGIKSDNERRQRELDCDKFAGFAIRKLGGSIESLKKAIKSIPHPKNNTGSHPTYERRLASALEGYKMGVEEEKNILKTLFLVQKELKGSYAFAIMFKGDANTLYAMRKDSPLVVGKGENGFYPASDVSAFLDYTREFYKLENKEILSLTENEWNVDTTRSFASGPIKASALSFISLAALFVNVRAIIFSGEIPFSFII